MISLASVKLWVRLGSCEAPKKLESYLAIASYDSHDFLVISNLPRASISRRKDANHEPIAELAWDSFSAFNIFSTRTDFIDIILYL